MGFFAKLDKLDSLCILLYFLVNKLFLLSFKLDPGTRHMVLISVSQMRHREVK